MNPIKTFIGTITNMPGLYLHILLTEEDDVIVARCLDFSVSSHGENKEEALASLNDSIADYLDYALKQGASEAIIDPEEDMFWDIFKEQQLKEEIGKFFKENKSFPVKSHGNKTMILPYALKGLIRKFDLPEDIFDR